ncbi:DUF937 domain-containing protein [Mesorhizobium sp. LHD-90]|uniref:DUF937 domain-containing protein n=1 Tax=Mesorhizobium sp. LHD-90 TaxID=3071414 RepID=UPI0027DECD6D|nr:DUF937 domain-containing protein [Mesorhizobium sp. LHD-90]MDQ6435148.1 DUF937 domain-containing protein [Mesorhizobium sp. LHD-90]
MASNIVSLVSQFLTPDIIARIAAILGLDRGSAQSAIGAAVPALLAGLVGAASKPSGAQKLADAVKDQSGILDGFAGMLGGGQSTLADQGSQVLGSLLGGDGQAALAGAVSKFAGLDAGKGSSLVGMLAPAVLGMIGKEAGPGRLDASGLASLLNAQKGNIAQALPAGFGDLLGRSGLLDSLGGAVGSTAASATRAAANTAEHAGRLASSSAQTVGDAGRRAEAAASGVPRWLYWLVALLVILGLLWYLFGNRAQQAVETTAPAAQGVVVGGVDIGKQLGDGLGALRTSLESVTDAASANAALPKLQEFATQLDTIGASMAQATPEQKTAVKGLVEPAMATLNQLFDKVLAIPGVGDVLKPTVDALRAKLASLAA